MQIQKVRKTFGSTVAVNDISFDISTPQMVGIIGRSGAGKSTLLRVLNRLTPATSGRVIVEGRNILELSGTDMRRWQRDCAMIFQQFSLVPRLDVVTNVMLGRLNQMGTLRALFSVFSKKDVNDALAALERLGLSPYALQRAETLSGGQQQRVGIARALMQAPNYILADEPIASLDPISAEVVMQSLREIHERDKLTVICNLHTLDTARTYCDRIIGIREGNLVFDGTADELTTTAAREIYGADTSFNESVTSTRMSDPAQLSGGTQPVNNPAPVWQAQA